MNAQLRPGDTIGILGGGQLGRMLALAAAPLGLRTHIYAPEADSPAFDVAARRTVAGYDDATALAAFAEVVDAVTYEFENVPAAAAEIIAARRPLHPGPKALATTQDRWLEKSFVAGLGIATAPFAQVDCAASLQAALERIGRPAVLKTRRFGYDGKGQVKIGTGDDIAAAWRAIAGQPAILEGFVDFASEASVLVVRGAAGEARTWDLCLNRHANHILAETVVPAEGIGAAVASECARIAMRIADALDYRGVMAVELFVARPGGAGPAVLVNEIAPRVHNSGHWTIEGSDTSQFEQHIRAVAGWPLGSTARRGGRIVMRNLVGDEAKGWRDALVEPGCHLHLYGKADIRPGRKMGHVTRILP